MVAEYTYLFIAKSNQVDRHIGREYITRKYKTGYL
jgi:hypothetical protein